MVGGAFGAIGVTAVTGAPSRMPDIALGSAVLFHLERVVALLACYVTVLVMLIRGSNGQLPMEVSTQGLKYAAEDLKGGALKALEQVNRDLEQARAERVALRSRIEAIEGEAYRGLDE
jgi:hypothetical protein